MSPPHRETRVKAPMMVGTHSAVHGYYWRRKAHAPGLAVSPCALVLLCIYAPQGPSARAWLAAPAAPRRPPPAAASHASLRKSRRIDVQKFA